MLQSRGRASSLPTARLLNIALPCTQMESGLPAVSKPKGIRARLRWMLGKQSKQAIAKQQVEYRLCCLLCGTLSEYFEGTPSSGHVLGLGLVHWTASVCLLEWPERSSGINGDQADDGDALHLHHSRSWSGSQAKDAKAAEDAAKQAARSKSAQMGAARPAQTAAAKPSQTATATPGQSAAARPVQTGGSAPDQADAQTATVDRRSGSFTSFLSKRSR